MVPLPCARALLLRRDTFGAAARLWWAGQSLMVSHLTSPPRASELVLLGGRTGAEHP